VKGRPSGGYVCAFEEFPGIEFPSATDETGTIPGLVCARIETPLPGGSATSWATFWKLLRLIEGPF
jgi:hypothetical protein